MMRYYKLMYDFEHDQNYIGCSKGNLNGMNKYLVSQGIIISQWDSAITFEYDPKDGKIFTDYLANVYGWLLVSERFRKLTDDLIRNGVQYLDILVRNINDGTIINTYQVANIIQVTDAIDLENSVYDILDLEDEQVILMEKYALKRDKIDSLHIFKLKDDTIPIFISEEVKKIIVNNNLLGFDFLEVMVTN